MLGFVEIVFEILMLETRNVTNTHLNILKLTELQPSSTIIKQKTFLTLEKTRISRLKFIISQGREANITEEQNITLFAWNLFKNYKNKRKFWLSSAF